MRLHWVDLIFLLVLGLSVFTGLIRGFLKEFIACAAWALAIWLAFHESQTVSLWLQPYIHDGTVRLGASITLIVIGTLIATSLVNMILMFFMQRSGLSGMDRILGMGFGFVRGVFMISLVLVAIKITALPVQQYTGSSVLYRKFDPVVNWLAARMPGVIQQIKQIDSQNNLLDVALNLEDIDLERLKAITH